MWVWGPHRNTGTHKGHKRANWPGTQPTLLAHQSGLVWQACTASDQCRMDIFKDKLTLVCTCASVAHAPASAIPQGHASFRCHISAAALRMYRRMSACL